MSLDLTWRDADEAFARLLPMDLRILEFLPALPFAPVALLRQFLDVSPSYAAERAAALRDAGVLAVTKLPSTRGRPVQLLHLTDLGLAVAGRVQGCSPDHLAQTYGLHGSELAALQRRLTPLMALYRLLGLVAGAGPVPFVVENWERPCRPTFRLPGRNHPERLNLPGYLGVLWADETSGEYFLLPDDGRFPVRMQRSKVAALFHLRAVQDGRVPVLVVAADTARRAVAWRDLIEDVCAGLGEARLGACIGVWDDIAAALPRTNVSPQRRAYASLRRRSGPRNPPQPDELLPVLVGTGDGAEAVPRDSTSMLDEERDLLELIGQHPFLTITELTHVSEGNAARCDTLLTQGLVKQVQLPTASLSGPVSGSDDGILMEPVRGLELTETGLKALARQYGLAPHAAVRQLGLAASEGPALAVNRHRHLWRYIEHTRATDRLFVCFVQDVRRRQAQGADVALAQWWPAARCGNAPVQPDAYGVYEVGGVPCGFFLECDRGTERAREYRRKLEAYLAYRDSGAYRTQFSGFPTILIVTVDKCAEDRIIRAVLKLEVGRTPLPVLVTNEGRVGNDPDGFLGCVWRGADPAFCERSQWPVGMQSAPGDRWKARQCWRAAEASRHGAAMTGKSASGALWLSASSPAADESRPGDSVADELSRVR